MQVLKFFNQVLHKNLLSDYYNILIILIKNQQQQQQQKTEQEKFTTYKTLRIRPLAWLLMKKNVQENSVSK